MNNEEKFKQSLQNKIESKEFPFDEQEWDKAAAIIDAAKKGNNRGFIFFLTSALLLVLGYLSIHLVSSPSNSDLKALVSQKTAYTTERPYANTSQDINHSKEVEATPATSFHQETPQHKEPIKNVREKNETASSSSNSVKPSATSDKLTSSTTEDKLVENTFPSNIPPSLPGKTKEETVPKSQNDSSKQESILPSSGTEVILKNDDDNKTKPSLQAIAAFTSETDQSNSEMNKSEDKTPSESKQKDSTETKALAISQVSVQNTDTNQLSQSNTPAFHNFLSLELGSSYVFGWKNQDGRDANGFNPVVGINYLSQIFNKYWLSIGIHYTSMRNLSYSSKTSKVTRYKLGEESDVTTITPSVLHFLSFPLNLNYQLNEKNSFGIAYRINYLFNVESKVETYTQSLMGSSNSATYTSGGYTEGFKLFHSQVAVFYRRELIKDLYLNTELFFGLNDLKENGFFNTGKTERNSGIQLTLTYNLFKH